MKVTLINKDRCKDFYKEWGLFACQCYNTNQKYAENVGKSCHKTRHYSGSRGFYFIFEIKDIPRSAMDQLARHEQGVVKNIQSQRYTDSSNLEWYTPSAILKHGHLLDIWDNGFKRDSEDYETIVSELEKLEGWTGEKAREVARGRVGMDIHSSATFGFTIEAIEHIMNKRLCMRSQEAIRKIANLMREELLSVLPELKEKLVPECMDLGYCNENKMQCSLYKNMIPTKDEFDNIRKLPEYRELIKSIKSN